MRITKNLKKNPIKKPNPKNQAHYIDFVAFTPIRWNSIYLMAHVSSHDQIYQQQSFDYYPNRSIQFWDK